MISCNWSPCSPNASRRIVSPSSFSVASTCACSSRARAASVVVSWRARSPARAWSAARSGSAASCSVWMSWSRSAAGTAASLARASAASVASTPSRSGRRPPRRTPAKISCSCRRCPLAPVMTSRPCATATSEPTCASAYRIATRCRWLPVPHTSARISASAIRTSGCPRCASTTSVLSRATSLSNVIGRRMSGRAGCSSPIAARDQLPVSAGTIHVPASGPGVSAGCRASDRAVATTRSTRSGSR